jgi:hypothetical protein
MRNRLEETRAWVEDIILDILSNTEYINTQQEEAKTYE